MASTWGTSWGTSWGVSWNISEVVAPAVGRGGGRAKRYVSLKRERSFDRKYFDELQAAKRALLAAEASAEKVKRENTKERQSALLRATDAAREALDAAREQRAEVAEITALKVALDASRRAKTLALTIEESNRAVLHAMAIIAAWKQIEDEDEEEAIALLLMH